MIKDLKKLFCYHELLYNLSLREIKSRYKQTAIGIAWALFQPLTMMIVFTIVFSYFAKIQTRGVPYPLFSYCGLVVWSFFSNSLSKGTNSITGNINLVTKIYFPREIFPFSIIISNFIDFLIASSLFLLMAIYYKIPLTLYLFVTPAILIIQTVLIAGLSLFLSALNVFKRDIGYLVPIVLQIWMFLSPVVYPVTLVPEEYRWLYMLNPLAGIIEGYRKTILFGEMPPLGPLGFSAFIAFIVFSASYFYFKKVEKKFADVI